MTPEELQASFSRAVSLVDKILRRDRSTSSTRRISLIIQAQTRLEQCRILLKHFRRTELEHIDLDGEMQHGPTAERHAELSKRLHEIGPEIRLYGECFYRCAWSAREAINHPEGLQLDFYPEGVRRVRNQLIEHADKPDGVLVSSWMFDCPEGLVLGIKLPWAADNSAQCDEGLYPNAIEFIELLLPKLVAVVLG